VFVRRHRTKRPSFGRQDIDHAGILRFFWRVDCSRFLLHQPVSSIVPVSSRNGIRALRLPYARRWLLLGIVVVLAARTPLVAQSAKVTDPVALAKQGIAALDQQHFGDALDVFTQAAKLLPRDPSLCLGAGIATFRLGHNDDAEMWFTRALKLDPSYTDASQWLGELQYREGRISEAIATYEAALKRKPGADGLEQRLADWRKETQLQDRFYESRGAHFRVLFEGPADELLARRVVERLEDAYWRIGAALTAYPPDPITVVLYTTEQFADITRMPAWTAAAYDGRIRVPIRGALTQTEELDRVLSHEFVHAVVAMLGGRNVPVWLNEGLAVTFEPGGGDAAEKVLARAAVRRPPLQNLQGSFSSLSAADARVAYAFSAHAVRRMMDVRGPYAIIALLQDLSRGADFAGAFQQRMAMRYDDFQAMVARE
jgi:tetratricopeptide (TPR) repeat protein